MDELGFWENIKVREKCLINWWYEKNKK